MISCFVTKPLAKTYYINGLLVDAGFMVKEKVDVLVITHCHIDHIIYANEIKKIHNCKIAVGRRDALHLKKLDLNTLNGLFGQGLKPIIPDIILKEGDIVNAGNLNFKVIETPGHTEGSISLFEERKGILFSALLIWRRRIRAARRRRSQGQRQL